MKAKYATACAACGRQIDPGEEIISAGTDRRSGWSHADCRPGLFDVEGASGPVAAAVQPKAAGAERLPTAHAARLLPPDATAVYTDGSCAGNPGVGGWAWAVADGRQDSGGATATTNQRMEIHAALEAVRAVPDSPLVVVSDSTYVVNCFRDGWWEAWRARGWRNAAKQPVANRDLWEPLVDLVERRGDVTFQWVKGHSGDLMNDLVDRLAVEATAAQRRLG